MTAVQPEVDATYVAPASRRLQSDDLWSANQSYCKRSWASKMNCVKDIDFFLRTDQKDKNTNRWDLWRFLSLKTNLYQASLPINLNHTSIAYHNSLWSED